MAKLKVYGQARSNDPVWGNKTMTAHLRNVPGMGNIKTQVFKQGGAMNLWAFKERPMVEKALHMDQAIDRMMERAYNKGAPAQPRGPTRMDKMKQAARLGQAMERVSGGGGFNEDQPRDEQGRWV